MPKPQKSASSAEDTPVNPHIPTTHFNRPVPQQKISVTTIVLATIGSILFTILLAFAYIWLGDYVARLDDKAFSSLFVVGSFLAVVFLPSIIVALVVLPKLRKK